MKIVLTQSEDRLEGLAEALRERGHEVVRAPLVRTETLRTPAARVAAHALSGSDWLLFSSRAGVCAWHELDLGFPPAGPKLGAVGTATARDLEGLGGRVALVGAPQNAEGLAACFVKRVETPTRVGLVQGSQAQTTLRARLAAAGHAVRVAVVYATSSPAWQDGIASGTVKGEPLAVLLASPSAVRALPDEVAGRAQLISLGPSTSRAVRARGWYGTEASRPNAAGVIAALAALERAQMDKAQTRARKERERERLVEDDR